MKTVVSVSLGSSTRDHRAVVNLLGEDFDISRVGTDGKLDAAIAKRETCRIYVPDLCEAAGLSERAAFERRRFEMIRSG